MDSHSEPVRRALSQLRKWKANLAGENDAFADIDEALDELGAENPQAMLAAFVAFFDEGQDMEVVAPLAAGPLEDFLAAHGAQVIEDVERLARAHPNFQHALGGVWQNEMSDAVWERVLAAGPDQRW